MPQRILQGELMDDPGLDPRLHRQALRGLRHLNRLSRSASIMWHTIRPLLTPDRPTRLLDIATGSGDLPLNLWRRAERAGLALEIVGCDRSEIALGTARIDAAKAGAPLTFIQLDVLNDPIPAGFDIICCSLFFHHLKDDEVIRLLRSLSESAPHFIVNDLVRTRFNTMSVTAAAYLATRSRVVHIDAYRSMLAAYTPDEVRSLCGRADLKAEHMRIRRAFPCRMTLTWSRES